MNFDSDIHLGISIIEFGEQEKIRFITSDHPFGYLSELIYSTCDDVSMYSVQE
jgi:hypothetical protein